jgi:hypothetical protein
MDSVSTESDIITTVLRTRITKKMEDIMQTFSSIKPEHLFVGLPDLISLAQAGALLGLGKSKRYELVSALHTIKVGKGYMVLKMDLAEYVVAHLSKQKKRRTKKENENAKQPNTGKAS